MPFDCCFVQGRRGLLVYILKGWGRFDLEDLYGGGPWWVSKVFLLIVCLDHRCISQVLHPYFEDNSNLPFF